MCQLFWQKKDIAVEKTSIKRSWTRKSFFYLIISEICTWNMVWNVEIRSPNCVNRKKFGRKTRFGGQARRKELVASNSFPLAWPLACPLSWCLESQVWKPNVGLSFFKLWSKTSGKLFLFPDLFPQEFSRTLSPACLLESSFEESRDSKLASQVWIDQVREKKGPKKKKRQDSPYNPATSWGW